MAYLPYDPSQDEDKDKAASQAEGGPVLGAPTAAPIQVAGGGQAATATKGNAPTRSGSFTNLMSYVNANKGNDGAMAGAVRNNVQGAATAADAAGTTFLGNAKSAIGAGTVQQDTRTQQQVRGLSQPNSPAPAAAPAPAAPPPVTPAKPGVPKAGGPNVQITNGPQKVSQDAFSSQYNAEYTGPKDAMAVDGFGDTQAAHNKVANYGLMAAGDSSDRGTLLSDVYGKDGKQYTGGERKLDSFILGAGDQGQQAMRDIARDYGGYGDKFRGLMDTIGYAAGADGKSAPTGLVGEGITTSDATRAAMRGIVDETQGGFSDYFDPLQKQAKVDTAAAVKLAEAAKKGDVKALAELGLSPDAIALIKANPAAVNALLPQQPAGWGLGDLADDHMEGNYGSLLSLLSGAGADATPAYTFDTKGGRGAAVEAGLLSDLNAQSGQLAYLEREATRANENRDAQYKLAMRDPYAYARQNRLMDPAELDRLQAAGVDLRPLLREGTDFSVGDMLTNDKTRSGMTELFKLLGIDDGKLTRTDATKQGHVSLDSAKLQQQLAQLAEIEAAVKAEEEARAAAAAATAQVDTVANSAEQIEGRINPALPHLNDIVFSDERVKTNKRPVSWGSIKDFLEH